MERTEDKYVKIPALVHATRVDYAYVSLKDKEPNSDWDIDTNIFLNIFRESLSKINNQEISLEKCKYLINKIKIMLNAEDLGRAFYNCLQYGLEGYKLLDFNNIKNNNFSVTTELPYVHNDDSFRPDIIFLINGMPLNFMEVKRQNNKDGIIAERNRMFNRFRNPIYRRFVNITQVMAFSNNQEYDDSVREPLQGSYYASSAYGEVSLNHFREEDNAYIETRASERNAEVEKEICKDNNLSSYFGTPEYESSVRPNTPANRLITSIYSPERIMFLLQYGICYVDKINDEGVKILEKHVMRYPQFFATKATKSMLDSGGKKGVIWHTQGSGKTAFSFFLTRYLQDYYQEKNKITHFYFIVDRLDLADQASDEFRARGAFVNIVNSRDEFVNTLQDVDDKESIDYKYSITVVNIQKFSEDSNAIDFDYNLNVQRIYYIDEAHRDYKKGKTFLTNLVSSDRGAVMIALTGTPLVEQKGGNNTKDIFGDYIHKYFYNQSIADGYTLKLMREEIETAFKLKMQKTIQQIKELYELEELKTEVGLKKVFEHDNYVKPLVDYIIADYIQFKISSEHNPGVMIVAYSSDQARKIYREIQMLEQDISSTLILHDEGSKEDRKDAKIDFVKGNIDIVVVYNMLLTGFDAHRLKKMYLCRKIAAHNLLQALTRVNRPYEDFAFGYIVDFLDISEEYDKTNRAYLKELTEELGDAVKEYSSLFESPEQVKADLNKVKDMLAFYTTENIVEFENEISNIDKKEDLYNLRYALERYKELKNVAQMFGYEELYKNFDINRANQLLYEVNNRISLINQKEALSLKDMSTGAVNVLLAQLDFTFRKINTDELAIADEFQDKLKKTYAAFANNLDNDDPEYIKLFEELKSKFRDVNIEEMTSSDMAKMITDLDELRSHIEELNRKDAQLQKKYNGDTKFVRIFKTISRTPPPLSNSPAVLMTLLGNVKTELDEALLSNNSVIDNEPYFEKKVQRILAIACDRESIDYHGDQFSNAVGIISNEYFVERRRAS